MRSARGAARSKAEVDLCFLAGGSLAGTSKLGFRGVLGAVISASGAGRLLLKGTDGVAAASSVGCAGPNSPFWDVCSDLAAGGAESFFEDGVRNKLATCDGFAFWEAGVSVAAPLTNDWQPESMCELMLASFTALPQMGQSTILYVRIEMGLKQTKQLFAATRFRHVGDKELDKSEPRYR